MLIHLKLIKAGKNHEEQPSFKMPASCSPSPSHSESQTSDGSAAEISSLKRRIAVLQKEADEAAGGQTKKAP
jgi:hypothetical protein